MNNTIAGLEQDRRLRHARLDYSIQRLGQDNLNSEKVKAAFAVRLDSDVLGQVNSSRREATRDKVASALKRAGDLPHRATDFFVGLHWWLRGRFRTGPEVHALVKSQAVLNTAASSVCEPISF